MAILKQKIKASSLTEVLVATVLIVVLLGIAITTVNNVLQNNVKNNTQKIENELFELQYLYRSNQIKIPFYDDIGKWDVSVIKDKNYIVFKAVHSTAKKKISKKIFVPKNE